MKLTNDKFPSCVEPRCSAASALPFNMFNFSDTKGGVRKINCHIYCLLALKWERANLFNTSIMFFIISCFIIYYIFLSYPLLLPCCPKGRRSCVGQSLIWLKNFSFGLRFGVGVSSWGPHTAPTSTRIRSTSTSSTRTGWPGSSSSRWPASPHHPASSTPEILKSFIKLFGIK